MCHCYSLFVLLVITFLFIDFNCFTLGFRFYKTFFFTFLYQEALQNDDVRKHIVDGPYNENSKEIVCEKGAPSMQVQNVSICSLFRKCSHFYKKKKVMNEACSLQLLISLLGCWDDPLFSLF